MMTKKDKPNLDLDFSEIGTMERSLKEAERGERSITKKPPPPRRSKSKFADIVLSIPSKEHDSKFVSKTIEECSGLEFVKWANNVAYPLDHEHTHYNKEANREAAFIRILQFHRKTFLVANPEAVKTLH